MFALMTFVHSLAWNNANAGDANDFVHANNHEVAHFSKGR